MSPWVFRWEFDGFSFTCISVIHLEPLFVCAGKWGSRHTFESIWRTNCLSIVYGKHHLFYCLLDHDSNFDLWVPFGTITHFPFAYTKAARPQALRISLQRNYTFPALSLPLKVLFISIRIWSLWFLLLYHTYRLILEKLKSLCFWVLQTLLVKLFFLTNVLTLYCKYFEQMFISAYSVIALNYLFGRISQQRQIGSEFYT